MRRQHFHDDTATERALFRHEHATHATATELALRGLAAGPAPALEMLDALFAGPMPTTNEMF
jgi:hypothetical protein